MTKLMKWAYVRLNRQKWRENEWSAKTWRARARWKRQRVAKGRSKWRDLTDSERFVTSSNENKAADVGPPNSDSTDIALRLRNMTKYEKAQQQRRGWCDGQSWV